MEPNSGNTNEQPRQSPTEGSKSFLRKAGRILENMVMAVTPGGILSPETLEKTEGTKNIIPTTDRDLSSVVMSTEKEQDPTKASKSFLRSVTDRLFTNNPEFIQLVIHGLAGTQFGKEAFADFMQGNYTSAAVEGIIAGVFAISPIRGIYRLERLEGSEDDKKA